MSNDTVTKLPIAHVGIVVPDLEAARDQLTQLCGIEWLPVKDLSVTATRADGSEFPVNVRVCLSAQEPGFELIEEAPGTPWVCNEHSNLHHISFASDTIAADSDSWLGQGCPLEFSITGTDGAPFSAYHRAPFGTRIELKRPLR